MVIISGSPPRPPPPAAVQTAPEKDCITNILEILYAISSYSNSETELYQTYSGPLGTLLTDVFAFCSHVGQISPYIQTCTRTGPCACTHTRVQHTHTSTDTRSSAQG